MEVEVASLALNFGGPLLPEIQASGMAISCVSGGGLDSASQHKDVAGSG